MTSRGVLRVFGICTLVLWALLLTILLAAHTVVAVEKGRRAWRDMTWRDRYAEATDTSMTTGDTAMTDTMATDTMAPSTPTLEQDLATIRAAELAAKNSPNSVRTALARIRAEAAAERIAKSKQK